jgi:hypothetical protein
VTGLPGGIRTPKGSGPLEWASDPSCGVIL